MDVEILQDYLVESKELLQKAQEDTLRLEADPGNDQVVASIFRAFHTIKGGAGFLEASNLVDWAHDLEDLLEKLRSHTLPITSARIDAILKGMDVIEQMFRTLAEEREPGPGPVELGRTIKALALPAAADAEILAEAAPAEVAVPAEVAKPVDVAKPAQIDFPVPVVAVVAASSEPHPPAAKETSSPMDAAAAPSAPVCRVQYRSSWTGIGGEYAAG